MGTPSMNAAPSPFPVRRPRGALGKSQKCDFGFCEKIESRNGFPQGGPFLRASDMVHHSVIAHL